MIDRVYTRSVKHMSSNYKSERGRGSMVSQTVADGKVCLRDGMTDSLATWKERLASLRVCDIRYYPAVLLRLLGT